MSELKYQNRMKISTVKFYLSHGSKAWFRNHVTDQFVKKAKQLNYRSRAAFKLQEIQQKFEVLGKNIIDLGSAPGSWSQFIQKRSKQLQRKQIAHDPYRIPLKIVSVDILDMKPIEGVDFYKCDARDRNLHKMLKQKYGQFDSIVSDMAPNFTGQNSQTHQQIIQLNKMCVKLALQLCTENCNLVMKTIEGVNSKILSEFLQILFQQSCRFKPKASRSESKQFFLVCKRFNRKYFHVLKDKKSVSSEDEQISNNKQKYETTGPIIRSFINNKLTQILFANSNSSKIKINKPQLISLFEEHLQIGKKQFTNL